MLHGKTRVMVLAAWFAFLAWWPGPAAACPAQRIRALTFVGGVPDAQGLIDGKPNPNQLASGDDILLGCDQPGCTGFVVTLTDSAGQIVDATFQQLPLGGYYWRLHIAPPLAAGEYTLKTASQAVPGSTLDTFVFQVVGTPAAAPLAFEIAWSPDLESLRAPAGSELSCEGPTLCGPLAPITTQLRPRYDIVAASTTQPSHGQMEGYLYHLQATNDATGTASDMTGWTTVGSMAQELRASFTELKSEYCVEVQALRIRDLEITSLGTRCLTHVTEPLPFDPAPYGTCMVSDPIAYARAWCTENREACLASSPHAADGPVRAACQPYTQICAPFIGNRTADDFFCDD